MTKEQIYELIGDLAIVLYAKRIRISLRSLMSILEDRGVKYASPRGMGAGVAAAYRMWEGRDDLVIPPAIAETYVDQTGEPAWRKYQGEAEPEVSAAPPILEQK